MIEVKARKKLGKFLLDSEMKDENVICLVGKNGSGKSSLLNIIAGIHKPDEGYVKVDSEIVTDLDVEKKGIVLVTPDSCLPHFNVEKHLLWGAKLRKRYVSDEMLSDVKKSLGINYEGRVSELSLGMQERVSLATALLAFPRVILVDEAFSNIDNRTEFIEVYCEYARKSTIDVIISTQNLEDSKNADSLYQMEQGRILKIN